MTHYNAYLNALASGKDDKAHWIKCILIEERAYTLPAKHKNVVYGKTTHYTV
jgi:hypothetical protein